MTSNWIYLQMNDFLRNYVQTMLGELCVLDNGVKVHGGKLPLLDVKYLRGKKEAEYLDSGVVLNDGQYAILVDGENSGEVFRIHETGYMGSTFKRLACPDDRLLEYLLYIIKFNQKMFRENKKGSAIPHLDKKLFKELSINLPPLAEQGRIVAKIEELFAGIDAGVENLKAVKNQIALYRQSVLKSAFNIKNAVIQKASEIGEVSLGRQRSPKNISKFYPTKYIRAANISENGIDVSDILDMEFLPYEKEKYLLKQNDILLSEASGSPNQVGKPAIWNNEIDDCCFQNTVIRHRLFSNHPKYVFWFYKYLYLSSFFAKLAGGVGINHIGSTKFSNIEIPIPSLDEQKRIVAEIESRFERADALETAVDRALSNAEKLKQAVLKKAFSGELVPQNPDDEPASVLLDRIRAARASELPAKKGKRK